MKNIKLTWKSDGIIDSYTLYRSTVHIDLNNLPEALVTGLTLKEYIDSYDGESTVIYYMIASVRKDKKKLSEEYVVVL